MAGKVAVLCPSRGRPDGLQKLVDSVKATSNASVYAYVDDDWVEEYRGVEGVETFVGPKIGPVRSANALVHKIPKHDAYGMLTDDMTVTTKGWDEWLLAVIDAFPGRVCVIGPSHNMGMMLDVPFVSREWIDQTGWYACPQFYHWCWPTVTALIGEMTAIVHAPVDRFAVLHDAVHHLANNEVRGDDNQRFFEYVSLKLPKVVDRLRKAQYAQVAV